MNAWYLNLKLHIKDKSFLLSLCVALLLLFISLLVNFYAGLYATESASNSVTDIVLSNTRVYDVDVVFIYGSIFFWIFVILLLLTQPKHIPFTLKSIAVFVLIRSLFISLTHIGPFPTQLIMEPSKIMQKFAFGGDLFFSGHTGLPFLLSLIFWKNKYLRYTFILVSITFGVVVLMGHIHYSIDVLSAFFITYTIYHISTYLFKSDRILFLK